MVMWTCRVHGRLIEAGGLILLGPDNHCREYAEAFEPNQYFMDILLSRTERPAA